MKNILMNVDMTKAILDGRKVQTRRVVDSLIKPHWNNGFKKLDIKKDINIKTDGFQLYQTAITEKSKDGLFGGYISAYNNGGISARTEQYIVPKYEKDEVIWVREPAKVLKSNAVWCEMECEYLADNKKIIVDIDEKYIDTDFDRNEDGDKDYIKAKWIRKCQGIPNGCIKEMARIFLKITDVRVERLQDMSQFEYIKEGSPNNNTKRTMTFGECEYNIKWWQNLWNKTASKGYKWEDNPYVFVYEFERVNRDGNKL